MPSKSRSLLDELCLDPQLAYWPHNTCSFRVEPRYKNRDLYNRWINNLVDELILDTPKEIEMEIENHSKSSKDQPMELDNVECVTGKESSKDKAVDECNKKETKLQSDKKAVQLYKPTELSLNLRSYKPEEIKCSVKDGRLTIQAKKQKKTANGFYSQSYERSFTLPKNCDQEKILCSMDTNGLIKLNIPHKKEQQKDEIHEIKINHESIEEKATTPKQVEDDQPIVEDVVEE